MLVDRLGVRALLEREQIKGMATDHTTARAAEDLVRGDCWDCAGWVTIDGEDAGRLFWAEFPEPRRAATLTTVSIPEMRATCTCAAARFPCRHIIAVLLRDLDVPLEASDTPPEWLAARGRAGAHQADDLADELKREAAVVAGMADLRLWLSDMARRGLADLPKRGRGAWSSAANRLVDAYALEAARELREMSLIPGSSNDWPEQLLPRLGRLALLCEAFRRLPDLSSGERGDALAAAGYSGLSTDLSVADEWQVCGQAMEVDNRVIRRRIWLRGWTSDRWAMLEESCAAGHFEGVCFPTGAVVTGDLSFFQSAYPLPARPGESLGLVAAEAVKEAAGQSDIDAALSGYSAALAANPWLRHYPLAIREVFIEPPAPTIRNHWRARDRDGHLLPFPAQFGHGWRLLALAADHPLSLFGEWNGTVFTPLSVYDRGWRALAGWRAVP